MVKRFRLAIEIFQTVSNSPERINVFQHIKNIPNTVKRTILSLPPGLGQHWCHRMSPWLGFLSISHGSGLGPTILQNSLEFCIV